MTEVSGVLDDRRHRGVSSHSALTLAGGRRPDARRHPQEAPAWSSLNCSVFYTDVAAFSAPCRTEADRQLIRDRLYAMLRAAFESSGVSWAACYREDRGDGVLVIVPPGVPTRVVADPLLAVLAAELRRHNRRATEAVRIALRAALHVGPVTRDAEGLNGDAIIHTARMLDAPPLREALRASGADLAFMASEHVFATVLSSDTGLLDPTTFTQVSFRVKESQITAWMHVAGHHATIAAPQAALPPPSAATPLPITRFDGQVHVDGDLVIGSKFVDRP
jgi:hypothetical protein